jgi:hypothetical protein
MPINGLSLNTLKKDRSLSGDERIPLYTTTKSKPAAFTTVDDILAKLPPPAPSGVTSIDGQTGDLPLATINGVSLLQNTDIVLGATVTYANVFFVDPTNGSDSTGLVNRFDKPYLTYNAASTAALALSPTVSTPALVVLRKGIYTANLLLKPYVYVDCEEGVVFTANGFYDDINTVYSRVYGKACFYVNAMPLTQLFGSDIYMEFDECIQEATLFKAAINSSANGYVQKTLVVCNKIESNCKNGYAVTARYAADFTLHVKQWIKGPGSLLNPKYLTGSMRVYCPKTISDNRTTTLATGFKSCIWNQGSSATCIIEIYGDLYNTSNNFTYSPGTNPHQSCASSIQCTGGITRIFGNIYAGDTLGIYTVNAAGNDSMNYDIKGNISSKSVPVLLIGNTNKVKVEGEVNKLLNDAIAMPCIYANNSCEVYVKNTALANYNTVASSILALDSTAKAYLYNCTAFATAAGDKFLNDTSVGSFGCNNVKGNVAIGGALGTALFTPQDYIQVTGLVLPNF